MTVRNAEASIHLEVRLRLERYLASIDEKDWDGVARCFSDDAQCRYDNRADVLIGGTAVADFIRAAIGTLAGTVHVMGNVSVRIDGETALARSTALVSLPRRDRGVIVTRAVEYQDALRNVRGDWMIVRRVHRPLWQAEHTAIAPTLT